MRSFSNFLLLFLSFTYNGLMISQTYISDIHSNNDEKDHQNIFSINNNLDHINYSVDQDNYIFINQVGENNEANVNIVSNSSDINILQNGIDNSVFLKIKAEFIKENIVQKGDNHNFVDFSSSSNIHNLELVQNGNSQNLIFYGGNSISEDLKITMGGENQSLIIRNFK